MTKSSRVKRSGQLLLVVTIVITLGVVSVAAQSTEPKTVADFFRIVPERYIGFDRDFREGLLRDERRGAVIDIPNGYISWDASDNPEEFEFAIFKKSNGKYLVAIDVDYDSFFPNTGRLYLLSYERGKWRDVTRTTLPVRHDKRLTYKLPREGRTIEVTNQHGRRVYSLTWANDRFSVKRPPRG